MIRTRLVHLLIIAALLCSQLVSAAHIVGHLHVPEHVHATEHAGASMWECIGSLESAHYPCDHGAQREQTPSCSVYHIHAGAHFLPQASIVARIDDRAYAYPLQRLPPVRLVLKPGQFTIRGPPVFS